MPPVIIVSGLPRSGTSMMMQALQAGGVPTVTDDHREPDESNPKGYHEYEPVKHLKDDPDPRWLYRAGGKAVKIVWPLVRYIPDGIRADIIFMDRPLDEVLASQERMIERSGRGLGRSGEKVPPDVLRDAWGGWTNAAEAWANDHPGVHYGFVSYPGTVRDPDRWMRAAADIVSVRVDPDRMAEVVDPDLRRERAETP